MKNSIIIALILVAAITALTLMSSVARAGHNQIEPQVTEILNTQEVEAIETQMLKSVLRFIITACIKSGYFEADPDLDGEFEYLVTCDVQGPTDEPKGDSI